MTSKYTRSAKNQNCEIRVPGVCNYNPETTVFAHLGGAGMGTKHNDLTGAYACSDCHAFLDGGWTRTHYTKDEVKLMHYDGMVRTIAMMVYDGVLVL